MKLMNFAAALLGVSALVYVPANAAGSARNGLKLMKGLNVIVLEDLHAGGGEIEGKAYVGGNVSGNSFQIGFGNSTYGQAQSFRSTLAVGGNLTAQVQLSNGPNGSSGTIGSFGAYVAGNVTQKLNLNSDAAKVRVGGNLKGMNYSNGTTLNVVGNVIDKLTLGDNSVTRIGGKAEGFEGGNNNVVLDVTGKVGTLQIGTGTVRIGGALDSTSGGNNVHLSVVGKINGGSLGSGAVVKAGGNVKADGTNSATIYTAGNFTGQNRNGATIHEGFAFGGTGPGAVAAPVTPAAPVVGSLAAMTAVIKADVEALSTALGILAATNTLTTAQGNANQISFTVLNTDPLTAAVFNLTAAQFASAQQFQFNFASLNKPVIFNISGATNGVYTWNAGTASAGISTLQDISQNVIWNFLDATTLNINVEIYGSVLAAKAIVNAGSNINGSVVARMFNQSAEVHLGTYARSIEFLPNEISSPTPEPGVWVQLIAGFGFTGTLMRRRRKSVVA